MVPCFFFVPTDRWKSLMYRLTPDEFVHAFVDTLFRKQKDDIIFLPSSP